MVGTYSQEMEIWSWWVYNVLYVWIYGWIVIWIISWFCRQRNQLQRTYMHYITKMYSLYILPDNETVILLTP